MDCQEALESLACAGEPSAEINGHLRACASCRQAEASYRLLRVELPKAWQVPPETLRQPLLELASRQAPRRRRTAFAAAAAVLLLAGFLTFRDEPGIPPPPAAAPTVLSYPRELRTGAVTALALGPGSHLEADAGTIIRIDAPDRLTLDAGRLYLQVRTPIRVRTSRTEYAADDAAFVVRVGRESHAFFLGSAWAEELDELLVVEGTVTVTRGDRVVQVEAEKAQDLRARLAWRDGNAAAQDLLQTPWIQSGKGTARLEAGRLLLSAQPSETQRVSRQMPLPGRFAWTAVLKRQKGGYLEVFLPSGNVLTLGEMTPLGDGAEHVLTLRWDLAPVLLLDGVPLQRFPREARESCSIGLGIVDGSLEVRSWSLKELP